MIDDKRLEPVIQFVKGLGISPNIEEIPYSKGQYAACGYDPNNPKNPAIIITDRANVEDVVHELCHAVLALEGYPRTYTRTGDQLANILASSLNSIVEHGRLIRMGDQLGFNLRVDERQMSKMELKLNSGDMGLLDVEAIYYADITIRCSDQIWWERMNKEYYAKKYPDIRSRGQKFLKLVKQYGHCMMADQARGCFRKLANEVGLKENEIFRMYPKPS